MIDPGPDHYRLPRLLYIGDPPPEATVESPSVLYRLLEEYPAESLRIAFRDGYKTQPSSRLQGVTYDLFYLDSLRGPSRYGLKNIATLVAASGMCRGLGGAVKEFQPEAILTIAHGFGCLVAAEVARRLGVPLHLIVHDDWINWVGVPRLLIPYADRRFARVYRQAASRLCISPYMEREYQRRYGVAGEVLYPQRPSDLPDFDEPASSKGTLVVAFAGTVWSGYAASLRKVGGVLEGMGGKLLIYSPHSKAELAALGLTGPAIDSRPFVPARQLVEALRLEADIQLVLMDFGLAHNNNMLYAFPSKLAVYTAAGVAMLIWGPAQCSAVRWAKDNEGIAEVVDSDDVGRLEDALGRLGQDRNRRYDLAMKALVLGRESFSYVRAREKFYKSISQ